MANLDMKKTLKHLYKPSAKDVSVVDIPPMNYLMIDGTGNPGTSETYDHAVKALYTLAYNIRAICKADDTVFTVMPLEGLWEFDGQGGEVRKLTSADKGTFIWTLMILQPEFVTEAIVEQARETAAKKKGTPALLDNVRFESYHEGDAVQLMYIGSYDDEAPTVARLHAYIDDNNHNYAKKHHEIYLSDPRKVAPEKLKTVIRQPFSRE
ncbi:MAG: GyrI-like domain-containing protein [Aggregatilineales bacterium]